MTGAHGAPAGSDGATKLSSALAPRSVAVVGVSEDPLKYGSRLARSIIECEYPGDLFLINPKEGTFLGRPLVPSLSDVGRPVDLVVVSVPNVLCEGVIAEAHRLGCGSALVVANGFAEMGRTDLQQDLVLAAKKAGIPLIGPNCMGLFSSPGRLNAMGDSSIPHGRIAVVAQSGNVGISIYHAAKSRELGLSYFISMGNQADVAFHDVLDYLVEDEHSDVVLLYVEGFRDLPRFLAAASRLAQVKPVVILRGGRSPAGARSAMSHTASMMGDDRLITAALRAAGLLEVDSTDELVLAAMTLIDRTRARGRRVSVVADSGGYATLGADAAVRANLLVEPHSDVTKGRLSHVLLAQAATGNPVDLIGGPEIRPDIFQRAVEACMEDPAVDAVVLVGAFGGYGDFGGPILAEHEKTAAGELIALRDRVGKPLVVQTIYANSPHAGISALRAANVPVVVGLDDAMHVMALKAAQSEIATSASTRWNRAQDEPSSGRALTEEAAREWFTNRIPGRLNDWCAVEDSDSAALAVASMSPAVMKVLSSAANHKSDVGGVLLNLHSADDGSKAWHRIEQLSVELGTPAKALVTRFETGSYEAFIGAMRHPELGMVVVVGTGGVFAEAVHDQAILFPPFGRPAVEHALDQLALGRVLASARATDAMRRTLVDLVVDIGELVSSDPDLLELDLNPVLLSSSGTSLLDVRVVVST